MNVTFHQGFTKNLEGLDGSLKAKAWDFVTKLNKDPEAPGLDLKLPNGAHDRRVRTARVDLNYRAVLFLIGEGEGRHLVLAAIKPHDDAYDFASRATMKVNTSSGAMELRILDPGVSAPLTPRVPPVPPLIVPARRPEPKAQCLPFTISELADLGIDQPVAERAVTFTDEGDLLTLVDELPKWQSHLLLDLASGRSLTEVRQDYVITPVDPDHAETDQAIAEALARPSSQMEFAVVTDDGDLRRMLAGDFAEWRVFLHPTQRAIAYKALYNGPFRLSGGAGTGKTVVALHRARHLASASPLARVLLCTFNRTLATQLKRDLLQLAGTEATDRIDVLGVDQLARQVVSTVRGSAATPIDDRTELGMWQTAAEAAGLDVDPDLSAVFLRDEYRYVVLAQGLREEQAYLTAPRRGRGQRLNRAQRRQVWKASEQFAAALHQNQRTTFLQLAADAAQLLEERTDDNGPAGSVPRYDHIVVDEGQDLQPAHWRMLRALTPMQANDLFMCEDGHQRLYGQRVVLSRLGIETRGRSRKLTLNYRTTGQNLRLAMGILNGVVVEDLDGELDSTAGYRSVLTGPAPKLRPFTTRRQETTAVIEQLKDWLAKSDPAPGPGTIGVLVRRKRDATALFTALTGAGITARLVTADTRAGSEPVHVITMHSAKGSEFQKVIVAHADDSTVPDATAVSAAGVEGRDDALMREQFLLYVAVSRPRDELIVTWTGKQTRFLADVAAR